MRLAPYLLAGHATSLKLVHRGGGSCDATPEWPGWSGIKYAFTLYVLRNRTRHPWSWRD